MAYLCRDCSYRGKKGGSGGACPACGSFNVTLSGAAPPQREEQSGNSALRIRILIGLWLLFFALVAQKLLE
ncbi:hypothetical protein [Parahaliea aestuarii]|uniref:Hydrogenase maturation nickel metallochaperone HypA n=1 Tax=Parahaliea aestuarii TaxID=1852021 RepID=A0A5C8ZRZ9_9GAMM|nr:hypothetical protein [Parahaliea aestuarii]TXS90509.1 hypothetical protein FVW59_14315 [Parahaliea aestuarii]